MSPRLKRVAEPPSFPGPLVFDALITPHRSLTARGFLLVMGAFSSVNVVMAIFWALKGAWPILFFLVFDVVLLAWALRLNYAHARMFERVRIDADCLHVTRQPVRGEAEHWVASPHWARVEHGEEAVRIAAGDGAVSVRACLSPPERDDLAVALRKAISAAKR